MHKSKQATERNTAVKFIAILDRVFSHKLLSKVRWHLNPASHACAARRRLLAATTIDSDERLARCEPLARLIGDDFLN